MDTQTLLATILERLIRIETRLTKLLVHLGLDPQGKPMTKEKQ
jgi:hypothetical protein